MKKVVLKRDNGMEKAKAGDIIEVTPAHADFLIRYGWAEPVDIRERVETPEKRTTEKKTTRKRK